MALADSDAESSQAAKPRFKQLGRGAGRRRAPRRFSFETALQGALDGGFSSEDEGPAPQRPTVAAREEGSGEEGAVAGEGDFVVHAKSKPKAEKQPRKDKAEKADKGSSRKRKADKEEPAAEGPACEDGGARDGLQEEIKRKRERLLASRRAKLEAAGKENAPQKSFKAQLQEAIGADGSAGEVGAAAKGTAPKRKAKPLRTRVVDGDTPEKDKQQKGEGSSPDDAVRFHLRGGPGGKEGGRARGGGDDESGSEAEPDEDEVRAWKERLAKRADPEAQGMRTAFSIKVCDPRAIRRLGVECFLGERGVHEGGKLLCDDEGKVNLHFLLGTYGEVLRARQRRLKGEPVMGVSISADARKHLRWLVRVAREERLINRLELRRGRIAPRRQERIQKSGRLSLELEANLADDSDAEQNADAATQDKLSLLDVKFPERQGASMRDIGSLKRNLGSQFAVRQAEIHTKSSHDMDLDKARSILTAPKLSCDWEDKTFEDDDAGGLDVFADVTATKGDSKRDLFRDVMRRANSFRQAKNLSTGPPTRSASSQSLNAAAEAAADAAGAAGMQPKVPAPPTPPVEVGEPLEEPAADAGQDARAVPAHEEAIPTQTPAATASEAAPAPREAAPRAVEAAQTPGEATTSASEAAPAASSLQEALPAAAQTAPVSEEVVPSAGEAAPRRERLLEPAEGGPSGAAGSEPPTAEAELHELLGGSRPDGEGPRASLGLAACPDGADTQPWADDVSPTAMWGATATGEHPRNKWMDLAPTVPFVPRDLPAAAKVDFEISPTAPFSPVGVAAVAPPPFEISPTAPLFPQGAPAADSGDGLQISPTVPFVPQGVPSAGVGDLFEISPTAPFVPQEVPAIAVPAETLTEDIQLPKAGRRFEGGAPGQEETADGQPAGAKPGKAKRGLKRKASAESDGSEGAASSPGAASLAATGPEGELEGGPESEFDKQRRQKEREWLRHKLKKQREEERLAKRRRAEADRKRRGEEDGLVASMSPEERETFLALHAGVRSQGLAGASAAQRQRAASTRGDRLAGRSAEPLAEDDDAGAVLLSGARPAQRQRGFFLAGATPLTAR